MSSQKQRTVLRTFRIPEDLISKLDEESNQKRINTSSIVNSIINKYEQWDTYAKRFRFISITKDTFVRLISGYNEDEIIQFADEVSSRAVLDFMSFKFGRLNIRSFLDCMHLITSYGYMAELEVKNEGPHYSLRIAHTMGRKVSIYFGQVTKDLLDYIAGIESVLKISENLVTLDFLAAE